MRRRRVAPSVSRGTNRVLAVFELIALPTLGAAIIVLVTGDDASALDGLVVALALGFAIGALILFLDFALWWFTRYRSGRVPWLHGQSIVQSRLRWSTAIRRRLSSQGTTVADLASRLGVGRLSLSSWLGGWREPEPRVHQAIAEELSLNAVDLLDTLGVLPTGSTARLRQVEGSRRWVNAQGRARALLEAALGADGISPGGRLAGAFHACAGAAREQLPAFAPTATLVVSTGRGHAGQFRTSQASFPAFVDAFQDYVAFIPTRESPTPMYGREWRHIVEQCIGPMWQLTAAHWEDSEELVNQMIEEVGLGNAPIESRSGIEVAIVPRFLATRDRAQEVEPDLPSSIVVLGVHHSGAPDVGSFLATRTGYAFALLSNLAVEQFGKVSDTRRRTFHEHELAVAFLEDPLGAGRLLVWAFNDHDALLQSLPTISSSQTDVLTVFLRADDDIVAYHAGRQALTELGFSRGGGARRELRARFDDLRRGLQAVQDSLERTVVGRDADRVVVLDVASPSVPAQPGMSYGQGDPWDSENPCFADDVDAFFACYADIAADLSLKLDLT